jgi:hypothetical protein
MAGIYQQSWFNKYLVTKSTARHGTENLDKLEETQFQPNSALDAEDVFITNWFFNLPSNIGEGIGPAPQNTDFVTTHRTHRHSLELMSGLNQIEPPAQGVALDNYNKSAGEAIILGTWFFGSIAQFSYVGSGIVGTSGTSGVGSPGFTFTTAGEIVSTSGTSGVGSPGFTFTTAGEIVSTSGTSGVGSPGFSYSTAGNIVNVSGSGPWVGNITTNWISSGNIVNTSGSSGVGSPGFTFTTAGEIVNTSGSSAGSQGFSYNPSGSISISGTSGVGSPAFSYSATGSVSTSGSSGGSLGFSYNTSGSVLLSGTAQSALLPVFSYSATGSVSFSGSASWISTENFSFSTSGNIVIVSGTSGVGSPGFSYNSSGSVSTSGSSGGSLGFIYNTSGSIIVSGSASWLKTGFNFIWSPSGNIVATLGSASTQVGFSYSATGSLIFKGLGNPNQSGYYFSSIRWLGHGNLLITGSSAHANYRSTGSVKISGSASTQFASYSHKGNGNLHIIDSAVILLGIYRSYTGSGVVTVSGTSQNFRNNWVYGGMGTITFSGSYGRFAQTWIGSGIVTVSGSGGPFVFFNPNVTTSYVGGTSMALLAPVISQTASYALSGKLSVVCPGAATIYVNSSLWSDREQSQLQATSGDSNYSYYLPAVGTGISAYGVDGQGNAGPTSSIWVVY